MDPLDLLNNDSLPTYKYTYMCNMQIIHKYEQSKPFGVTIPN